MSTDCSDFQFQEQQCLFTTATTIHCADRRHIEASLGQRCRTSVGYRWDHIQKSIAWQLGRRVREIDLREHRDMNRDSGWLNVSVCWRHRTNNMSTTVVHGTWLTAGVSAGDQSLAWGGGGGGGGVSSNHLNNVSRFKTVMAETLIIK